MTQGPRKIIVGITGASGSIYAQRLIDVLEGADRRVEVIVSEPGRAVLGHELGIKRLSPKELLGRPSERVVVHSNSDLFNPLASGSHRTDGMVVCPCSTHSLSAIAQGQGDTLLFRAAYVSLKERRPLILVPREAPLTTIDIENMLKVSRAGGIILPASPGFYNGPTSIDDLVDFVVGRILDLLNVEHDLAIRWKDG